MSGQAPTADDALASTVTSRRDRITRDEVLAKLRAHEAELRAAGVEALWLFGSVARDEAGPDSDVDQLFERDECRPFTIFDRLAAVERLSGWVGRPVDLGRLKALTPASRSAAERDAVRVY